MKPVNDPKIQFVNHYRSRLKFLLKKYILNGKITASVNVEEVLSKIDIESEPGGLLERVYEKYKERLNQEDQEQMYVLLIQEFFEVLTPGAYKKFITE